VAEASSIRASQVVYGAFVSLVAHAVLFVGLLLGVWPRLTSIFKPGTGNGRADVTAMAVTFWLGEITLATACLSGAVILIRRAQRDLGLGLLVGWLVGALLLWLMYRVASSWDIG
jgi:hypothetical protein